jgi:hypothetical protein
MKKILLALKIVQQKQFKDPFNKTYTKRRLNPYNPLTYILIIFLFAIGLIMFGVKGIFKEIDFSDLKFKYK